ncbi:hypothetical protein [Paramagnetospirillum magneticum]|uniref:hypothetical protein n=1 Tax=Paramagnetospirillum magneticum TaxID=84159 RepID=UPI001E2EA4A8|nr:hypothetical protein [Paramagnetospirillum magneticum]
MNGIKAAMAFRPGRHLGQAALAAADLDDLDPSANSRFQCLVGADGGIDERDLFLAAVLGRVSLTHQGGGGHNGDQRLGCRIGGGMGSIYYGGTIEHHALFKGHDAQVGLVIFAPDNSHDNCSCARIALNRDGATPKRRVKAAEKVGTCE